MINVVLVEDFYDLRIFLEETIQNSKELILSGSFSNAEDFISNFESIGPIDVVIMDINLPGINGIQCIQELKPKKPKIQYLICTVFEDNLNLFNALCAGATGYIVKSSSEEKIISAVIDIFQGGSPMSPQIARMVVEAHPKAKANKRVLSELSKRELEILQLLAAGYRYKEIADKVFLSVETIRSYIRNIYGKLQVHSRTDAINKLYNR